jgi:glycosyltransferase involved in cell wall biosynthesis
VNGSAALRVLCVASFEEVKGHRVLLEACRLLQQRGVAFECDLVGDGPLGGEIRARIARYGLASRVRLHGPRTRDEIVRLLGSADVFALASVPTRAGKREGIPVVLMEAMASELPVVASRLSGIPELVEHGVSGLLAPPGDAAAFAEALAVLAGDPSRRAAMGRAGRERVQRDFDLGRNAATLAELFAGRAPAGVVPAGSR